MSEPILRGLGRLPSPPDERDENFPAHALFGAAVEKPTKPHQRWYTENLRLDQGKPGQCALVSAAHLAVAGPITQRPYSYQESPPPFDTIQAYCRAQEIDRRDYRWSAPTFCQDARRPGGPGDTGVTMRSAAKVMQELGYITNYWWLQSLDEILAYLTNVGPVWMGTAWYSGMSNMDAEGFIRPEGESRGGHAYLLDQIVWRSEYVWMLNSWGRRWGIRGRAKIRFRDLETLRSRRGEALAITEHRKAA